VLAILGWLSGETGKVENRINNRMIIGREHENWQSAINNWINIDGNSKSSKMQSQIE
jgi:head-tail adaptor